MCCAIFFFKAQAELLFLLAFNRDEFFSRPTSPVHFWEDDKDVLAGRDLERHGTWLGVTRQARFAFLTNFREVTPNRQTEAPSRGELVKNFLQGSASPMQYLLELPAGDYNGFNLVVGDISTREVAYLSNRDSEGPLKFPPGTYGISNGNINSAWPKVYIAKGGMQELQQTGNLEGRNIPWDDIFNDILGSTTEVEDEAQLPRTGLPTEWERTLSPIFIKPHESSGGLYGTRQQMVLAIFEDGKAEVRERTCKADGSHETASHAFRVDLSRRGSRELAQWRAEGSEANNVPNSHAGEQHSMHAPMQVSVRAGSA
ncbi:hypothetical protein WJX73_010819 [Symbiochloris irregularis]|uniref:NRDE protein-domain-containing protein n=1 Tax=Symbiochloris irregularis TaxID=706552 RepID=A0AAW1NW49_9CHLO